MKNIALVVLSIALLVAAILAFGYSFALPGAQAFLFFGGIVLVAAAFFVPLSLLGMRRAHPDRDHEDS